MSLSTELRRKVTLHFRRDSVDERSMDYRFSTWMLTNWSRAALPMAVVLLFLAPTYDSLSLLVFLQLPVYMLHQYEEHHKGDFKRFAAQSLGRGYEVLDDGAILFINVVLVWGVILAVLYLARVVDPRLALIAPYLSAINGLIHVAGAAAHRAYNPGLWTSLALFLPFSTASLWWMTQRVQATSWDHAIAAAVVIALHAGIIVYARMRLLALMAAGRAIKHAQEPA